MRMIFLPTKCDICYILVKSKHTGNTPHPLCTGTFEKSPKLESVFQKKGKEAYDTRCSQAVTHPSTGRARRCLTSVIGREPVFSAWYGRRQQMVHWLCFYI